MSNKTFIIAEIANAHGRSLEVCLNVLKLSKQAGADAFKVATYRPEDLTVDSEREEFRLNHKVWSQYGTLWDLYENIHMPWEFHDPIFELGKELDLEVFSSPFSIEAADYLEKKFSPKHYKVASMESIHYPLIEYLAKLNKRIIVSTGRAIDINEIKTTVDLIRSHTSKEITVLHCTSEYPTPISQANLNAIRELKTYFGESVKIGLSDHSDGIIIPMVGVALGASVIEKHITASKDKFFPNGLPNPDVEFSLTLDSFEAMCKGIRLIEAIKDDFNSGDPLLLIREIIRNNKELLEYIDEKDLANLEISLGQFVPSTALKDQSGGMRRSLIFTKPLKKGDVLKLGKNFNVLRPGHGLHPRHLSEVEGKVLNTSVEKGEGVKFDYIA